MFDMENKNSGAGMCHSEDENEYARVEIGVSDGVISTAAWSCADDIYLEECVRTVCAVIKDKPAADVLQMNNNAVYYNCEKELPRTELYKATLAVIAAKRAAADYCRKNNIKVPEGVCGCG